MPDLIEAARAALAFIEEELKVRIDSHTVGSDLVTADEAGAAVINEAQILRDGLAAALNDPYPTRIILDVSTAHLCDKAQKLLDSWATIEADYAWVARSTNKLLGSPAPLRTHIFAEGWTVRVPWENDPGEWDEDERDFPESLRACLKVARANKAAFINFDADAEIMNGLPTYDKEAYK